MSRRSKQQLQAIFNFFLVFVLIGVAAYIFYIMRPAPFDPDTLCVEQETLPPHTAVIIDKTDEYDAAQADLIAKLIRRAGRDLEAGERFTLFELDARGQFNPRGQFSLCNPGRGDQVNPLFSNPKMIEEQYAAKFEGPLDGALKDLIVPKEAPSSPIMEALARLAQTEAFGEDVDDRKVILVSDMLQNSDLFTAYGGRGALRADTPSADDIAEAVEARFGDALDDVALEIRLIPREGYVDLQRGALRQLWDDALDDLGVDTDWRDL